MRRILLRLLLGGFCAAAAPVYAATGTSIFTGVVLSTCILAPVGTPGIMQPSGDLQKLSSKLPGGLSSTLLLTSTGGVNVSVSPTVSDVQVALGDIGPITWSPSFSINGTNSFPEGIVTRLLNLAGVNTVVVDLEGTKSGGNIFTTGAYVATVTVTCEPSGIL